MSFYAGSRLSHVTSIFLLLTANFVTSKIPVQFCKQDTHRGIDQCLALFSVFNASSAATDLYITISANRHDSNARGWSAFGLGDRMEGALMFITYGDPSSGALITSIRTATGHHQPTTELTAMSSGKPAPDIVILETGFAPPADAAPNDHSIQVATTKLVCYACDTWAGSEINFKSTLQPWIWAMNSRQDFKGDFGQDSNLDMHSNTAGFGIFWTDLTKSNMFAPITPDILPSYDNIHSTEIPPGSGAPPPPQSPVETAEPPPSEQPDKPDHTMQDSDDLQQPAKTWRGKSIRDWMWHLHGLVMSIAFLLLYPFGLVLIRSGDSRAFNFHWTTQAFASVLVAVGALIGTMQSKEISVTHQFLGLAIVASVAVQILLGWRHHIAFLRTKTKSWLSAGHVWLGRTLLGAGYLNLVLGLVLRAYGRATMLSILVAIVAEIALLVYMKGRLARTQKESGPNRERSGPSQLDEAEEYFQLVGDDEEDGWSEDDGHIGEEDEAKKERAKKLTRLDAV